MLFETLANATDLDAWSNRLDARGVLPNIVNSHVIRISSRKWFRSYTEVKMEERGDVTEEGAARARRGYELLYSWRGYPGFQEDGSVDSKELRDWINRARQLLKERGREIIGDQTIGGALIYTPPDPDGAWPHVAVRNIIEELGSEQLERGIEIGVYNSRGVFMKSPTAGGEQERQIAEKYQGYANQVADRWPRTAAMLRRIARSYISDARREDIDAELTEDLWR
jgi:hypothetical protein